MRSDQYTSNAKDGEFSQLTNDPGNRVCCNASTPGSPPTWKEGSFRHIPEEVVRPDGEHLLVFDEGCRIPARLVYIEPVD